MTNNDSEAEQTRLFDVIPERDFTQVTTHVAASIEHRKRAEYAGEQLAKQGMNEVVASNGPTDADIPEAAEEKEDETAQAAKHFADKYGGHPDDYDWRCY